MLPIFVVVLFGGFCFFVVLAGILVVDSWRGGGGDGV
jgi:hypothetical protein